MNNLFTLDKKTILVTGASSGIGKSIAITSSIMGASLIISGRDIEKLSLTMSELRKSDNQNHVMIVGDLSNDEDLKAMINNIDKIDGLVHCAGVNNKSLIKFLNKKELLDVFDINLFAPIILIKELLKHNKVNKSSSIVFISSISSFYSTISNSMYASSKGAINSLIRVLALELSTKKIRVNGIMPGMIETDMIQSYGLNKQQLEDNLKNYPLGRYGVPQDVANAAVFYLSDASIWITGSNLVVDGGVTLR